MSQSKNKYTTIFRKARRNKKTKRKKGGADNDDQLIDYALGSDNSNPDYRFDFREEIPPTSRKNSPKIEDFPNFSEQPGTTKSQRYGNPRRLAENAAERYKSISKKHQKFMNERGKKKEIQETLLKYEGDMGIDEDKDNMVDNLRVVQGKAGLKRNYKRAKKPRLSGKTKKRKGKGKGKGKEKGKGKGKGKNKTKGKK